MSFLKNIFKADPSRLTAVDFAEKIKEKGILLVDVRTTGEVKGGKIGNAQNFDVNNPNFINSFSSIDKNREILLYCQGGIRSQKAMKILKANGFTNVFDLKGGYNSWTMHN
ncbi:rhodanese-like domain-containing protein [Aureivirga sp. CE67]|uniref:rhodanese-like domain-containing protein n=1 Tax=Aureivirga sp. CE67 TaxID=1788983 RepID=UPI0018CA19CD|nr:rhodanese-like domain-containing protein [Aureivirga sp. CE67]